MREIIWQSLLKTSDLYWAMHKVEIIKVVYTLSDGTTTLWGK